jgi:hypothetical protein
MTEKMALKSVWFSGFKTYGLKKIVISKCSFENVIFEKVVERLVKSRSGL